MNREKIMEEEKFTTNLDIAYSPISNSDISAFTSVCINEKGGLDLRKFPDKQIADYYRDFSDVRSIIDLSEADDSLIVMIINFILYCFYYVPSVRGTSWLQADKIYITILRREISSIKKAENIQNYIDSTDIASKNTSSQWFINRLKDFVEHYDNPFDWYKKPVWNLRDPHFHIAKERINPAREVVTLNFSSINNPDNQRLSMEYIEHLLFHKTVSVSTIQGKLNRLKTFCQFLGDNNLTDVDSDKLDEFFIWYRNKEFHGKTVKNNSVAGMYGCIAELYDFLLFRKYIPRSPFLGYDFTPKQHWTPKESSVDDFVVDQIYAILPEMPICHALIFLIVDCCGLRISDVCRLKKKRLLSKSGERCFLSYYNTKEKRSTTTEIPSELHYLLTVYLKLQQDNGSDYLFPNYYGKAYRPQTFTKVFNEFIEDHDIKTTSGEPYRYSSHGLRHNQATDLEKRGASIYTIAKRLNDSLEVAVGYADYREKDKAADMSDFSDNLAADETYVYEIPTETDSDQTEYLRRTMNGLTIPHGSCKRPAVLGDCNHDPSFCLKCEQFVTCKKYIGIHKKHLTKMRYALELAVNAGDTASAEKIQDSINVLEKIIDELLGIK